MSTADADDDIDPPVLLAAERILAAVGGAMTAGLSFPHEWQENASNRRSLRLVASSDPAANRMLWASDPLAFGT